LYSPLELELAPKTSIIPPFVPPNKAPHTPGAMRYGIGLVCARAVVGPAPIPITPPAPADRNELADPDLIDELEGVVGTDTDIEVDPTDIEVDPTDTGLDPELELTLPRGYAKLNKNCSMLCTSFGF